MKQKNETQKRHRRPQKREKRTNKKTTTKGQRKNDDKKQAHEDAKRATRNGLIKKSTKSEKREKIGEIQRPFFKKRLQNINRKKEFTQKATKKLKKKQ